jgi:hypothetical protein
VAVSKRVFSSYIALGGACFPFSRPQRRKTEVNALDMDTFRHAYGSYAKLEKVLVNTMNLYYMTGWEIKQNE